jgi:signal transduction histidine kinase
LQVTDDGSGFAPRENGHRGIGLKIMAYRARTIGGTLRIGANSPKGTVVTCHLDPHAGAATIPDSIVYE